MREGFLIKCFTPAVPLDPLWEMASSYDVCALQFFYATLLKWSGEGNNTRMSTAFGMLLGPDVTTFWIPGFPTVPSVMIAKMPTFSVVVVDGTADFQTLAMQAFSTIEPPQNFGIISTYILWYNAATYINNLCNTVGVDKNQPLMLVGYSYGAAAIDVLAARYNVANPLRKIRTLTFGAPKPGDQRLQLYLQETLGLSIANEDDIVCSLSPSLAILWPVAIAFNLPELIVWDEWRREPNRARQALDGTLTYNVDPIIDTPLLTHLLEQILGVQPFDPILPHRIAEYRRRIEVRCPVEQWPISKPLWDYLHEQGILFNVGLQIGAQLVENPILCACCGESPTPDAFGLEMTSTDYPELDGVIIVEVKTVGPPLCEWFGEKTISGAELDLTLQDWEPESGLPVFLSLTWLASPYGDVTIGAPISFADFHCSPWDIDVTLETTEDGTPTSKTIHFKVVAIPEMPLTAGLSIGATVSDVEPDETFDAGLSIGAVVLDVVPPELPLNAGFKIGARLVTIGPTETFNAGFKIGSKVLPPLQKPGFKIGAKVADP